MNSFLIPDSSDEFNRKHDLAKFLDYLTDRAATTVARMQPAACRVRCGCAIRDAHLLQRSTARRENSLRRATDEFEQVSVGITEHGQAGARRQGQWHLPSG